MCTFILMRCSYDLLDVCCSLALIASQSLLRDVRWVLLDARVLSSAAFVSRAEFWPRE